MMRATSAVADVTVFLLLVGAATTVILSGASAEHPPAANPAADQASMLAASTAHVSYNLTVPDTDDRLPPEHADRHRRTAHGTVAQLLGEAAMSNVTVDGTRISTAGTGFESAVRSTARDRLGSPGRKTSVRVRWEPYPGAPISSEYRVGDRPPADANVRAATVTVPSGMENASAAARSAAVSRGYDGVATVVARCVVDGLFPPDRTRYALRGDYPADVLMQARYERTAELTGTTVAPEHQSTSTMNRRLTAALARQLRVDMRSRFDSPVAAARAVRASEIRVTVRTWSP
ncbi:DUF7284 family protein [Haloarcula salina]|uniref:DUF7284 family protein n=1 Tax=Haloarcula salina TaxID=1429914 RepID=UPI003C6F0D8D